jgi:predicted DNA binding CopG/RHH family protein
MMKYFDLTKEELEIVKAFEAGKLKSDKSSEKMNAYRGYAGNTLSKTKSINLRLPERVLIKIKAKAMEEGLPYQTLISSLLHKYVNKTVRFV